MTCGASSLVVAQGLAAVRCWQASTWCLQETVLFVLQEMVAEQARSLSLSEQGARRQLCLQIQRHSWRVKLYIVSVNR